jgi:hypothetical protein
MATAKGGYFTSDGERVPSVTTILGRYKESGALIHWAAGQAAKYVADNVSQSPTRDEVLRLCDAAKNEYRNVRDKAADAGTMAHEQVEHWIKKEPVVFEGTEFVTTRAKRSFEAFLEWADQTQLEVTHTECPLVSNVHRFGGTLDAMLVRGKRSLGDWKTSNAVYGEYLCQIAAYGILWEENYPDQPIEGGYHLLRFDKTFGDFKHHWWSELETAKRQFLLMRQMYENEKELKARAA